MNLHNLVSNDHEMRDKVMEELLKKHNWDFHIDPNDENRIMTNTEGYCWRWWLMWAYDMWPRAFKSIHDAVPDYMECLSPDRCRQEDGYHER